MRNSGMRKTRIYYPGLLSQGQAIELDTQTSVRIARVLRLKIGDALTLFNGQGGEYKSHITQLDKRRVCCEILEFIDRSVESPLKIHLAQGISKGERMDYTIQKAVELGVDEIIPLMTARTSVNLSPERQQRRLAHWQSIVISACEQCGRNKVPEVKPIESLANWLLTNRDSLNIVLDPGATQGLKTFPTSKQHAMPQPVTLLIGPEGGLSREEISLAAQHGFIPTQCGPRILRTETAAVAVLSVLQSLWGDFE